MLSATSVDHAQGRSTARLRQRGGAETGSARERSRPAWQLQSREGQGCPSHCMTYQDDQAQGLPVGQKIGKAINIRHHKTLVRATIDAWQGSKEESGAAASSSCS